MRSSSLLLSVIAAALLVSPASCGSPSDAEGESNVDGLAKRPRSTCDSIDQHRAVNPWLGAAIGAVTFDQDDNSTFRQYANGVIVLVPRTGCAVAMRTAMWDRWHTSLRSVIGHPLSDVINASATHQWQRFDSGSIYTSPKGTFFLTGAVDTVEWALNVSGVWPYPVADVVSQRNGLSAPLEDGTWLASTPIGGVHRVSGDIATFWKAAGDARGYIGFPISDWSCAAGICTQDFQWATLRAEQNVVTRVVPPAQGETVVAAGTDGRAFVPTAASCDATIDAHYAKQSAVLGAPIDFSDNAIGGGGAFRRYQNGAIVLNPNVGCAFFLVNGFRDVSGFGPGAAVPQPLADLGFPVSDELWNDAGRAHQYFDKGSLFWTSTLGIRKLTGVIAQKQWASRLSVGYPSTDQTMTEGDAINPPRPMASFENDALLVGEREAHAGTLDQLRAHPTLGYPSWFGATTCTDAGSCWTTAQHGYVHWTFPSAPVDFEDTAYFNLSSSPYTGAQNGPYIDEAASADLRPQPANGLPTVYSATFGTAPPTRWSAVKFLIVGFIVPPDATGPLSFLNKGWGPEGCNMAGGTTTFQVGQSATPDDLLAIFGTPYPKPGSQFTVCAPSDLPARIRIDAFIRINYGWHP